MSTTITRRPLVPEDLVRTANPVRAVSRSLAAVAVTAVGGQRESAQQWLVRHWPDWRPSGVEYEIIKAATNPAMTTGTWGAELLPTMVGGFLSGLAPQSAAAKLFAACVLLDFRGTHQIAVPRASTSAAPGFVAEGAPMRIPQDVFSTVMVGPTKKLEMGAVITAELEFYAAETATSIIATVMGEKAAQTLDSVVFDAIAADSIRPAGLLNSVSPITASTATPLDQAMFRDIEALVGAITDAGGGANIWLFANPRQATALKLKAGAAFDLPIVPVPTLAAGTVVAIEVGAIASGFSGFPVIDIAREATAHLESVSPLAIGTVGAPNTVAAPTRSGFQTNTLFLRLRLNCAWAPLSSGMVQYTPSVTW